MLPEARAASGWERQDVRAVVALLEVVIVVVEVYEAVLRVVE